MLYKELLEGFRVWAFYQKKHFWQVQAFARPLEETTFQLCTGVIFSRLKEAFVLKGYLKLGLISLENKSLFKRITFQLRQLISFKRVNSFKLAKCFQKWRISSEFEFKFKEEKTTTFMPRIRNVNKTVYKINNLPRNNF